MAAPVVIRCTLQEHRHSRDSWAVATVLIHEAEGELPFGVAPGCELGAVGDRLGLASPGQRLELHGTLETNRYGTQIRVTEQISKGIQEPKDACKWLERLDGVGPKKARQLYEHFGDKLLAILSGDLEADLTVVQGIGPEVERHIRDSYLELAISVDLESIRYLDSIKASRYEATKILAWCAKKRRKPIAVMERAPYDLMQVKGLGFKRVDRLARAAGCPPDAPARIEAATLHTLGELVQQGSTMARASGGRGGGLVGATCDLLAIDKALIRAGLGRLAKRGEVVIARDASGREWVHPSWLLKAERRIYQAATGKAPTQSAPLSQHTQPQSSGGAHGLQGQQEHGSRDDPNDGRGLDPRDRGPGAVAERGRPVAGVPRGGRAPHGGGVEEAPSQPDFNHDARWEETYEASQRAYDPHTFGIPTDFWE